jgi:hypothetical protein
MKLIYIKVKKLKITSSVLLIIFISSLIIACEDFVEIDGPQGELVSESIFSSEATTLSALTAIYQFIGHSYSSTYSQAKIEQYTGMASDELIYNNTKAEFKEIESNNIKIDNTLIFNDLWSDGYKKLSFINPIIEGVRNNKALSESFRNQVLGEALFFRAFFHFHLVNFFGDIPYANTSDTATLNTLSRMPVAQVYELIIADLKEAQTLMVDDYSHAGGKRIRANKSAATALLAKVYLYTQDWNNAALESSKIIQNNSYELELDLDNVFLFNSKESILQISHPETSNGRGYGIVFIISDANGSPYGSFSSYLISDSLFNSFEPGDTRFDHWIGVANTATGILHFPHKYKLSYFFNQNGPVEDLVLFRFAEQYLIRAEARTQQGDISGAQADINMIRNRAGLDNTTAATKETLLNAVEHERRIELMVEGGHRWYDLKRTGTVDAVMGPLKADWQSTDALFPIPVQEILNNSNLTQNAGY